MELFRITEEKFSKDLIASGVAGRWNDDGELVTYTSSSRSLSTLEKIIRFKSINPTVSYKVLVISLNTKSSYGIFKEIHVSELPTNWRDKSAYPFLRAIGSNWYKKKESLVLKVPSAIIPKEFNYIINTKHPKFNFIKILETEDYYFDDRFIAMSHFSKEDSLGQKKNKK